MPIPEEFDCPEVRMPEEEIDQFRSAIVSINNIVKAHKKVVVNGNKIGRENISSPGEAMKKLKEQQAQANIQNEAFFRGYKDECINGLLALKNSPDGRDPKSMLQWVKQFPYLLTRDNVDVFINKIGKQEIFDKAFLDEFDFVTIRENFQMARTWYLTFSDEDQFDKIYGRLPIKKVETYDAISSTDYIYESAQRGLDSFREKANVLGVLEKSEEELQETDFTGVFDEVKDKPAAEKNAQLIEEEIPRVAPKEEAPAQKEKIKPINISERIHVTEGTVDEFGAKARGYLDRSATIYEEIKSNVTPNNFEHLNEMGEKASVRLFKQKYGDVIQKEMAAMLAGPKEHSSNGALEWLESFPHLDALIGRSTGFVKACLSDREDFSREHMDLAYGWHMFFRDGLPNKYESDYVKHSGAKADEFFVKREKGLYDKAWKVVHKTEKTKIDSIVEKLENAKTFYNSGEYNQIIDIAKMLYHTDELPKKFKDKVPSDNPEAIHAFKLASIKVQIDAYIEHKAKDGVKPNVYHKLAAVEELNRYVSEELNRIGVKHIPDGLPAITTVNGQVPMSLKEEPHAKTLKSYHAYDGSLISDEREECRRTLDCMGRIMLSANALNLGEETMGKLDQLTTAFQNGPNVDLNAPQEDTLLNDNPDQMPVIDC